MRSCVYVALLHHSMLDKQGKVVTTSITNLDIHDIARSCRTYGVEGYFLVNPEPEQIRIAERIMGHWVKGGGLDYNPDRAEAFRLIHSAAYLDDAIAKITEIHGQKPKVVMTSAREVPNTNRMEFSGLRREIEKNKQVILLVFGTGWGMEERLLQSADAVLVPIRPEQESNYLHLSVRAAVVVVLDRLLGARDCSEKERSEIEIVTRSSQPCTLQNQF